MDGSVVAVAVSALASGAAAVVAAAATPAVAFNFREDASRNKVVTGRLLVCSYKRVKGRSPTGEKRTSTHPHKPHATRKPSHGLCTDSPHY